MPDEKLTDLTELAVAAETNDWLYVVDRSDTTDDPDGTSKKLQISNLPAAADTTLQEAYEAGSGPPQIIVNATDGAVTIRDIGATIGDLLVVESAGGIDHFAVGSADARFGVDVRPRVNAGSDVGTSGLYFQAIRGKRLYGMLNYNNASNLHMQTCSSSICNRYKISFPLSYAV